VVFRWELDVHVLLQFQRLLSLKTSQPEFLSMLHIYLLGKSVLISAHILKTMTKIFTHSLYIAENARYKANLSIRICTAKIVLSLLIKTVLLAQKPDAQFVNIKALVLGRILHTIPQHEVKKEFIHVKFQNVITIKKGHLKLILTIQLKTQKLVTLAIILTPL